MLFGKWVFEIVQGLAEKEKEYWKCGSFIAFRISQVFDEFGFWVV